jgi:flagellar hook assembly protein FlgD
VPPPVISVGAFTGKNTTIHLSLGAATEVSTAVYDVRGKQVRMVIKSVLSSGDHRIAWDGRDSAGRAVANGVYFCRVKAGVVEQTAKVLLMR